MLLSELKGAGRVFRALPDRGCAEAWSKLESLGQSSGPGRNTQQAERRTRLGAGLQRVGAKPPEAPSLSRDRGEAERAAETECRGLPLSCLGGLHRHPRPPPLQARSGPIEAPGPGAPNPGAEVHAFLP